MSFKNQISIVVTLSIGLIFLSFNLNRDLSTQSFYTKYNNKAEFSDSLILWDINKKLKWSDFLSKPDTIKFKEFKAVSSTGFIDKKNRIKGDSIEVFLYCYFNRYKSWNTIENKELLNHEQRHFDLTEVVVRRFRKRVSKYPLRNENSFWNWYLNVAFKEYESDDKYYTNLYDKETNYGMNLVMQEKWDQKIDKMLEELEEFSSPRVVIKKRGNSRDKSE